VRIVVPDDFPAALSGTAAETLLRTLGAVAIYTERGADQEDELIRRIDGAECVLNIRAHARFSDRVLASCPSLRMISIWGSGTDNVDLASCTRLRVAVANTPGVNAHAVAEHTMALMLAVARRIPAVDLAVRAGDWPRGLGVSLEGKTLGVIGLGAIGRRVVHLAKAFGMRALASTFGADDGRAAAVGAEPAVIERLLRESEVVSIHLRLSDDTRGYLGRDRLALMKPTAFFVNTARGALVDRDALLDALMNGRLAGAGLDVFHEEPIAPGDPLLSLPNVVLTPHNAGMTREVIDAGLLMAAENIRRFIAADH
jgi:D-3-phosphoglycerate dehydrogenase